MERIDTREFVVGAAYSRATIAAVGGVTPPETKAQGHWRTGILQFENAVLLLVTLDKSNADERYAYADHFEGRFFEWESQTQQTRSTPLIQKLVQGAIEPLLFVRVVSKDRTGTVRYLYCGRLRVAGEARDDKPVKIRFECRDYVDDPSVSLAEIYNWRPGAVVDKNQRDRNIKTQPRAANQGYETDPEIRRAVELHAMAQATQHYRVKGYEVTDKSATESFDLLCQLGDEKLHVEVKGTRSALGSVMVTANEVSSARRSRTDLFVLHSITIKRANKGMIAEGGVVHVVAQWVAEPAQLTPTSYRYFIQTEQTSSD